ncbi:MAG: hypothetical protein HY021_16235 [Burkholderiales bacterium]|nr:hypothetical protein [Burkholderiales bacterium]
MALAPRAPIHQNADDNNSIRLMMSDATPGGFAAAPLPRARRAIVVVDVVESVRLMQQHEDDVIDRWRRFVNEVVTEVLPRHGGRLVKSLGDGMLLEFEHAPNAMAAALEMTRRVGAYNVGREPSTHIQLRTGSHLADIVVDQHDIYGTGVNVAARLSAIAGAQQIIVSADVRDQLLPDIDAQIEDLGDCELRGINGLVRAYRVEAPAGVPKLFHGFDSLTDTRPTVAMLPLAYHGTDADGPTVAELITDDVIFQLSSSPHWRVISRLTSGVYRSRKPDLASLREQLRVNFVASGTCYLDGSGIRLMIELADAQSSSVIWADSIHGQRGDLTAAHNMVADQAARGIVSAIFEHEVKRSRAQPMPTLRSYTLLFGAVAMMHRLSRQDFARSLSLLEHLADRHRQSPEPQTWMAKWHVMNVAQGWSPSAQHDAARAQALTREALDRQGDHSLALAIDGLVAAFMRGDLDASEQRYQQALAANPNEALAWLFMSALHTYRDRGDEAVHAATTALRLSPLDPMRYFFDGFAANAMLSAGRYQDAIDLACRSIRANCTHLPVQRALAIAQVMLGQVDSARGTVRQMLRTQPGYTLDEFRTHYAGRDTAHAVRYAEALRIAGLPLSA